LVKLRVGHPASAAVAGAEEDAPCAAPVVFVELGGIDGLGLGRAVDDAHRSDEAIQRNLIERCAALDEMHRRIDVRARVGPEREGRQGHLRAAVQALHEVELHWRVAWIHRCDMRIDGRRDVDPARSGKRSGRGKLRERRSGAGNQKGQYPRYEPTFHGNPPTCVRPRKPLDGPAYSTDRSGSASTCGCEARLPFGKRVELLFCAAIAGSIRKLMNRWALPGCGASAGMAATSNHMTAPSRGIE